MRTISFVFLILLSAFAASRAEARPYLTIRDDGTIASFNTDTGTSGGLAQALVDAYDSSGQPRPEVISFWTNFNFDRSYVETIPVALQLDVEGIVLEHVYPLHFTASDPLLSPLPPTRIVLMHNNVMRLPDRAAVNRAPVENFADYLFLLELSHYWGPTARVPGPNADALIGFTFHWSFWMDAGGSPVGGNRWKDNGDGTFSTIPQHPADLRYSMLDLYLMGLADPSEVPPFGLLQPTDTIPGTDPFTRGPYDAASFPRFDDTPLTVTATRQVYTVDDIIAANGTRLPLRKDSPSSFTLGMVLLVDKDSSDADIAAAQAVFDPIAARLPGTFSTATQGRGSLQLITSEEPPSPVDMGSAQPPPQQDTGGCSVGGRPGPGGLLVILMVLALDCLLRRRRLAHGETAR